MAGLASLEGLKILSTGKDEESRERFTLDGNHENKLIDELRDSELFQLIRKGILKVTCYVQIRLFGKLLILNH